MPLTAKQKYHRRQSRAKLPQIRKAIWDAAEAVRWDRVLYCKPTNLKYDPEHWARVAGSHAQQSARYAFQAHPELREVI